MKPENKLKQELRQRQKKTNQNTKIELNRLKRQCQGRKIMY